MYPRRPKAKNKQQNRLQNLRAGETNSQAINESFTVSSPIKNVTLKVTFKSLQKKYTSDKKDTTHL